MPTRGLLLAFMFVGLIVLGATPTRAGDDCLRPAQSVPEGPASLADLGEMALERLPGNYKIVRANLSAERPRTVAACYLMASDLLVVEETGLLYCMSRRDLTPRWVVSLKAPLHSMPAEGPSHYFCLVKAVDGAYWVHAFAKR
ncbi:MAG: hypothetical protein ACYTG6_08540, partial [Planctomycetota bacterium]